MVTVSGYGNSDNSILPTTLLLLDTTYHSRHRNNTVTTSRLFRLSSIMFVWQGERAITSKLTPDPGSPSYRECTHSIHDIHVDSHSLRRTPMIFSVSREPERETTPASLVQFLGVTDNSEFISETSCGGNAKVQFVNVALFIIYPQREHRPHRITCAKFLVSFRAMCTKCR